MQRRRPGLRAAVGVLAAAAAAAAPDAPIGSESWVDVGAEAMQAAAAGLEHLAGAATGELTKAIPVVNRVAKEAVCLASYQHAPCLNGGLCVIDEGDDAAGTGYLCRCRDGFRGKSCENTEKQAPGDAGGAEGGQPQASAEGGQAERSPEKRLADELRRASWVPQDWPFVSRTQRALRRAPHGVTHVATFAIGGGSSTRSARAAFIALLQGYQEAVAGSCASAARIELQAAGMAEGNEPSAAVKAALEELR